MSLPTTEAHDALERELAEARAHQAAMVDVLRVISASRGDSQPVFEKILDICQHLVQGTNHGLVLIGEDRQLHLLAHRGPARDAVSALYPCPIEGTATDRWRRTGAAPAAQGLSPARECFPGGTTQEWRQRWLKQATPTRMIRRRAPRPSASSSRARPCAASSC